MINLYFAPRNQTAKEVRVAFRNPLMVFAWTVGLATSSLHAVESLTDADRKAFDTIRAVEIAAFSSGDVGKLAALWTDDILLLAPNDPPVSGKEAVRVWVLRMHEQFKIRGTYKSAEIVEVRGDVAVEWMTFNLTLQPIAGGEPMVEDGKGIHVYRRQSDGSWKISLDIWNSNAVVQDTGIGDEEAIRRADMAWSEAQKARGIEDTMAYYTSDPIMMAPNAPMAVGRDAIRMAFERVLATPGFSVTWAPSKVEVARSGEIAYAIGAYHMKMDGPDGSPVTDNGKYVEIWKKQADETWKCALDMFSSDLPSPAGSGPFAQPPEAAR